jgi:hypothetical protein
MAKVTNVYVTGPVEWAKVFPFNREMRSYEGELIKHRQQKGMVPDEEAGEYKIDIHLDKDQFKALVQTGAKQAPKKDKDTGLPREDEEGRLTFTFRRLHCIPKAAKAGGPPVVKFADGTVFDPESHGLIGNGTVATLMLRVEKFPGRDPKGNKVEAVRTTLQEITIDELVPYESEGESVAIVVAGGVKPEKAAKTVASDDDDEIPF